MRVPLPPWLDGLLKRTKHAGPDHTGVAGAREVVLSTPSCEPRIIPETAPVDGWNPGALAEYQHDADLRAHISHNGSYAGSTGPARGGNRAGVRWPKLAPRRSSLTADREARPCA